jgi:hypothetical protein
MRLTRILLAVALLVLLAGVAWVAQKAQPPGLVMVEAGKKFLASLTDEQKAKAALPFKTKERFNWNFVPMQDRDRKPTRKGLPLQEMTAAQKKAALALVAAGTSDSGGKQALTIMSLEAILHDLEKGGAMVRSPEWYFFTIFGTPSETGTWGWRVEGHHLSLNYVVGDGMIRSATPAFYGANPATVKGGAKKGQRTLAEAEDLAFDLFNALDEDQKKVAHRDKNFPEPQQGSAKPTIGPAQGLTAEKMTDKQRMILVKLVESYASRQPQAIAAAQLSQVRADGPEKITFAFAGGKAPGQPHSYRVQGPSFVIEFLNTQGDSAGNPANHIHSVWRDMRGDFGIAAGIARD